MIHENLIRELQYLWWNVLFAIGTKKEVREILSIDYKLATNSWKIPHVQYKTYILLLQNLQIVDHK